MLRRQARNIYLNMEHGTDFHKKSWTRGAAACCGGKSGRKAAATAALACVSAVFKKNLPRVTAHSAPLAIQRRSCDKRETLPAAWPTPPRSLPGLVSGLGVWSEPTAAFSAFLFYLDPLEALRTG